MSLALFAGLQPQLLCGLPEHIGSDNGPEMIAQNLRRWLGRLDAKSVYITPGSP